MLIMMIDLYWLRILMLWFLLYFIDIFVWDIDMLDYWWLILLLCLAHWFWFCHDCSDHFTCIHLPLYIIRLDILIHWFEYYFDHLWAWCLYHYSSQLSYFRLSCVYMMIYLSIAWLCVAWLPSFCMIACCLFVWVAHLSSYLQPFSLGHSFFSVLTFARVRPCVCLFLRPS